MSAMIPNDATIVFSLRSHVCQIAQVAPTWWAGSIDGQHMVVATDASQVAACLIADLLARSGARP